MLFCVAFHCTSLEQYSRRTMLRIYQEEVEEEEESLLFRRHLCSNKCFILIVRAKVIT